MVETEKIEQRGQSVKRLRSLFDMHHVAFGSPENLGGFLLSLHEDRHFAMDFWSVVNALTSQESGAPSEEELLETVIESATGKEAAGLPVYEQPGVNELRQILAGVDTARPTELPDAIHRPSDALLPDHEPALSAAANAMLGGRSSRDEGAHRSIGEALARLEETSRELREQLAALQGQTGKDEPDPGTETQAVDRKPVEIASEAKMEAERVAPAAPQTLPEPVAVERPFVAPPSERAGFAATAAPALAAREKIEARTPQAPVPPVAGVERRSVPLSAPRPAQPSAAAPVFEPKPIHQLSHRGLAIPEPDDDPSIVAPLSSYAEQHRGAAARYAIAAVVIAAVGGGGFFAARTDAGRSMLSSVGSLFQSAYAEAKDTLGMSTGKAQVETPPQPGPGDSTADAPAEAAAAPPPAQTPIPAPAQGTNSAPTQTPAPVPAQAPGQTPQQSGGATSPPPSPPGTVEAKPLITEPEAPTVKAKPPVPTPAHEAAHPIPPAPAKVAARKPPAETVIAAAKSQAEQRAEEAASTGLQRVPASTMARNLVASRVPAYPQAAKAQEIEGPVELELVVTPDGFVKYVRAIDGDRHLRAAAEEAVKKWRYRPYIQNGSAIEVVTTARVDFRLPQ